MAAFPDGHAGEWAGRANLKPRRGGIKTKKRAGLRLPAGAASAPDILAVLDFGVGHHRPDDAGALTFAALFLGFLLREAALLRRFFLGAALFSSAAAFFARICSSSRCLARPVGSLLLCRFLFLPLLLSGGAAAFFGAAIATGGNRRPRPVATAAAVPAPEEELADDEELCRC